MKLLNCVCSVALILSASTVEAKRPATKYPQQRFRPVHIVEIQREPAPSKYVRKGSLDRNGNYVEVMGTDEGCPEVNVGSVTSDSQVGDMTVGNFNSNIVLTNVTFVISCQKH